VRLGGFALIVGAAVCVVGQAVHPESPLDPFDGPLHVAYFVALMLVLLGLPAVIARQAPRGGILGLLGGVAVWLGLAMTEAPHAAISGTVLPGMLADPSTAPLVAVQSVLYSNLMHGAFPVFMGVGSALLAFGALALSGATLWARILPRWPVLLLVLGIGATVGMHNGNVGPTLFFAGLTGLGLSVALGLGPETCAVAPLEEQGISSCLMDGSVPWPTVQQPRPTVMTTYRNSSSSATLPGKQVVLGATAPSRNPCV
jgi:hypothetical protein